MDSISKKITSRPGFSKAILVIREKISNYDDDYSIMYRKGDLNFWHCRRESKKRGAGKTGYQLP